MKKGKSNRQEFRDILLDFTEVAMSKDTAKLYCLLLMTWRNMSHQINQIQIIEALNPEKINTVDIREVVKELKELGRLKNTDPNNNGIIKNLNINF